VNDFARRLDNEGVIDLQAITLRLWSRRRWIATSVLVCTALFAAVAFLATPVYRSATVFVPASAGRASLSNAVGGGAIGGVLGGLAQLAGVNLDESTTETQEGLAVLKSREFTNSFIDDWHLMPELFPGKWDAQRKQWKMDVQAPTAGQAYKYFNTSIRSIVEDRKTGLITLQIDWRDRTEAALWANELVRRLNAEMRERAMQRADGAITYLEKATNETNVVATREAISRLIEAEMKQRMVASVTPEYTFRVVDRATAPEKPEILKPRKLLLLCGGVIFGLVAGVSTVLLLDAVNRMRVAAHTRA
jgi:uncharacterized protein involved in exopolysaccharide biosynthesis